MQMKSPRLAVKLAKRKRYLQDIDAVIRDYERAGSSQKPAPEIEDLEKDLRAMRRARDNAKAELKSANDENPNSSQR